MTDAELLQTWREGEAKQKELWNEILRRGLYFESMGIDLNRRDSAWRNPPSATLEAQKGFFKGVRKHRVSVNATKRDYKAEAKAMLDLV